MVDSKRNSKLFIIFKKTKSNFILYLSTKLYLVRKQQWKKVQLWIEFSFVDSAKHWQGLQNNILYWDYILKINQI